jgi:hypothetical protein
MALPHNELTKKAVEELIEQWLNKQSEGLFTDQFLQELRTFYDAHPWMTCIPIIPPGQEDGAEDGANVQNEQPKPSGGGAIDEGYFEKRIGRIQGGPPPRGKPKLVDLPIKSDEEIIKRKEETEAIHRAIGVRR